MRRGVSNGLKNEVIDTLNIWARFIYAPLLDHRVRTIADGIEPGAYGRKEAFEVHKRLSQLGPVKPGRAEFRVHGSRSDRARRRLFCTSPAELNFYELFNAEIGNFDMKTVAESGPPPRGAGTRFKAAGVPLP